MSKIVLSWGPDTTFKDVPLGVVCIIKLTAYMRIVCKSVGNLNALNLETFNVIEVKNNEPVLICKDTQLIIKPEAKS